MNKKPIGFEKIQIKENIYGRAKAKMCVNSNQLNLFGGQVNEQHGGIQYED